MKKENPYPNEHAARLVDPKYFTRFTRTNNKFGGGVHAIWGIQGGKTELQAIRFDAHKFNINQAREWLHNHDFRPILFEPAIKVKRSNPMRKENPDWDKLIPTFMKDTKEVLLEILHSKKRSEIHPVNRKAIQIDRRQKKDRMPKQFHQNPHVPSVPEIARHIEEIIDDPAWANMLFALVQQMGLHKGLDHFIKEHPSFRPFRSALVLNLEKMGYGYKKNPVMTQYGSLEDISKIVQKYAGDNSSQGSTRKKGVIGLTVSGKTKMMPLIMALKKIGWSLYSDIRPSSVPDKMYVEIIPSIFLKKKNPGAAWHEKRQEVADYLKGKAIEAGNRDMQFYYMGEGDAESRAYTVSKQEHMNPGGSPADRGYKALKIEMKSKAVEAALRMLKSGHTDLGILDQLMGNYSQHEADIILAAAYRKFKKKRRNPGAAWHERQAEIEFKKANQGVGKHDPLLHEFYSGKSVAQRESATASRRGVNPKIGHMIYGPNEWGNCIPTAVPGKFRIDWYNLRTGKYKLSTMATKNQILTYLKKNKKDNE